MEKSRLNRESRERNSSRMVQKAGPWYDPQFENALKKMSLQLGIVTPSQVGLDLEKKKAGEKTALEMKMINTSGPTKLANDPSSESLPGVPGQGRPKLSKDQTQRKSKTFSPQTGAKLLLWANDSQERISDIVNPIVLEFFNKKNLRSLSKVEQDILDKVKTTALLNSQPFCKINNLSLDFLMENINKPQSIVYNYYNWLKALQIEVNRDLTVDEIKYAKSSFYASTHSKT